MKTDFLVIGSGIAGLNFALQASQKGKVLLITKKKLITSNTNRAQGGIAGVLKKTDKIESHVKDTLKAGSYHNKKTAVRFMVKNSREAIHRLIKIGVNFEQENGELKLTKEGGHSTNRIAYVGDYTGREIEKALIKKVKAEKNITIWENSYAAELIVAKGQCYGAQAIKDHKIKNIFATSTIIATGGIGQIFKHTSNPKIATGDGLAMGIRAGCKTEDLEFIQFHPTTLNKNTSPKFLLSETIRGEGAKLFNSQGQRFMTKIHKMAELAPRDIVSRSIYSELKRGPVYLDITKHEKKFLEKRFPQISAKLKKFGLNLSKDKISITPAAHYICGGLKTDLKGRTNIKNLFAFGEVSCTGVHGANRLASNSLLEALVFSNEVLEQIGKGSIKKIKTGNPKIAAEKSPETKSCQKIRAKIKKLMWQYAGIIRNTAEIKTNGLAKIEKIITELEQIKSINPYILETKNMALVSKAILIAASKRQESLGCHYIEL